MVDKFLRVLLSLGFFKKDRKLGVAMPRGHRYDLPLDNDPGAGFLMLLTGLLTFLAVLALFGASLAATLSNHWLSGLAGHITIEVPAHNDKGDVLSGDDHMVLMNKAKSAAEKIGGVTEIKTSNAEDIQEMITPFLGENVRGLSEMPLPLLLTVKYEGDTSRIASYLSNAMAELDTGIRIDTHESWLGGILKLSRALKFSTLGLTIIILLTTITALVSAMRARMRIHQNDIELLHLMGASNSYIAKQFQRHARLIVLKGSMIGAIVSIIIGFVLTMFASGGGDVFNLSSMNITVVDFAMWLSAPILICVTASIAARLTVLRSLAEMP